jgi:hypothetical protein
LVAVSFNASIMPSTNPCTVSGSLVIVDLRTLITEYE